MGRFTLGIEEEFIFQGPQGPVSHYSTLKNEAYPALEELIKFEYFQSQVEAISPVLRDIMAVREHIRSIRSAIAQLVGNHGYTLLSTGTYPVANPYELERTLSPRYDELEQELQDVARQIGINGLHIHVGVERGQAIKLINELRTWIPHLLALSTNSPFWVGRHTGFKSYRTIRWSTFPRSGIPDIFSTYAEFETYVQTLIQMGCIDNGKRIWWDIRPHPFLSTVEFRVFDMPATAEDTIALAALCQALVAKLTWLHSHNLHTPVIKSSFIDHNKFEVARDGLDASYIDFALNRKLSMREAIHELLYFVEEVVDELGIRKEIEYLRNLLNDARGTGADRQIAVYTETHSMSAVIKYIAASTMMHIPQEDVLV